MLEILDIKRGSPGLLDLANKWRAGNAGDTIAVVIISELPIMSQCAAAFMPMIKALAAHGFNLQNYLFPPTYTSL